MASAAANPTIGKNCAAISLSLRGDQSMANAATITRKPGGGEVWAALMEAGGLSRSEMRRDLQSGF
jgi:hypothetical protein